MTSLGLASHEYVLLFLPVAVLVGRLTASRPAVRTPALVLTSLLFYALAASPSQLALLLGITLIVFAGVRASAPSRSWPATASIVAALGVLAAFKFAPTASLALGAGSLLPLGISFYTFNLVSYAADARRGQAQRTPFLSLAAYSTFFPTVIAGPLVRHHDFQVQEDARAPFDADLFASGVVAFIIGLSKKTLVADPLGAATDPLFSGYERLGLDAWVAVLGYAYQLYFDFSGYTDMAIGAAAMLGFRLPPNFNAPYTAVHITDFWQRWHMTMSFWFRDYLFLPLSRALLRRSPSLDGADRIRSASLVLTMFVIGLWHGTAWSFLAWGLYHGVLLAGHARIRRARGLVLPTWAARALTFVAVLLGWVLLRSPSPDVAARIWASMAGVHGWGSWTFPLQPALPAAVLAALLATNVPLRRRLLEAGPGVRSWALAALLVASLLALGAHRPFLYFQF